MVNRVFNHILVPVDFTEKNRIALGVAGELAGQNQAALTLLHVVETIENLDDAEFQEFYKRLEDRSARKLDELAKTLDIGISIQQQTLLGKPVTQIVKFAMQQNVDLLVMNSHAVNPRRKEEAGHAQLPGIDSLPMSCVVSQVDTFIFQADCNCESLATRRLVRKQTHANHDA